MASIIELRGSILDVGIFRDTLFPTLALNTTVSLLAYTAAQARQTGTLTTRDILWPSAQVLGCWTAAVGRRVYYNGSSVSRALSALSRPETLILGGITIWGLRRISSVVGKRSEKGIVYGEVDRSWGESFVTKFLPEALIQSVVMLPITAPFYHQGGVFTGYHPVMQAVSVGLFSAGLALESLADYQGGAVRDSVHSVVRQPGLLGDALVHLAFPILLYSSDMLAPIELLGPVANYIFLRYVSRDEQSAAGAAKGKAAEVEQRTTDVKVNEFWPDWEQVGNKWFWIVAGAGALGAGIEQVIHLMGMD